MPPAEQRRAALVGIDGSGKTSVARRLRERARGDPRLAVLHTIRPHEAPDGPLHELSRHLLALSETADTLRSPELKIAAFYLQLCCYAPGERFFCDAFEPEVIVSDRHPLVDALVYLPLYGRTAAALPASSGPPPDLHERLEAISPGAHEAVIAWNDLQARRLGYETDLWSLGREMLALHADPPERLVAVLGERFRTALPDAVVLLEIEVEDALRRSGSREDSAELHETAAQLAAVRGAYDKLLAWLARGAVEVHRVPAAGRSLDATVEEIAAVLELPAARQPATATG